MSAPCDPHPWTWPEVIGLLGSFLALIVLTALVLGALLVCLGIWRQSR